MTTETNNKTTKTLPKLTKDQQTALDGMPSVSMSIRYLNSLGWERGQIATKLNKRYQHVRNVLVEDERLNKTYSF